MTGAGPLRVRPRAATLIDPFELKPLVPDEGAPQAAAEERGPAPLSSESAAAAEAQALAPEVPPPPSEREAWRQLPAAYRVRNVRARRWCSEEWP